MNDTSLEDDLPDPDFDEDEPITEVEDDDYPFVPTADEKLRCFIVQHMGNSDLTAAAHIANLEAAFQWVKTGMPEPAKRPRAVKE
jgi:hypothetical protein